MLFFRSSSVIRNKNLNWILCISFECSFLFIFIVRISSLEIFNRSPSISSNSCLGKCSFTSDSGIYFCCIYSCNKFFLHFPSKIVRKLPFRIHPVIKSLSTNSRISTSICIASSTPKSLLEFSDSIISEFTWTPSWMFFKFSRFLTGFLS